jgi:hypothetical protein
MWFGCYVPPRRPRTHQHGGNGSPPGVCSSRTSWSPHTLTVLLAGPRRTWPGYYTTLRRIWTSGANPRLPSHCTNAVWTYAAHGWGTTIPTP